jgi:hypothetical protein
MDSSNLVDILVALGVSGVIGTVVNFIFNRKGLRADATKVIAEAAATMTGSMEKRIASLEKEADDLRAEAEERRRYDRERDRLDAEHDVWDRQIYAALKKLDPSSTIAPPPAFRPTRAAIGADRTITP